MVLVNLGIAGVAGAAAMAISMALLSKMGEQKADMLRAVGSLITKQIGNALPVGLTIHLISAMTNPVPDTVACHEMAQRPPMRSRRVRSCCWFEVVDISPCALETIR